jgi:hypothetical protein
MLPHGPVRVPYRGCLPATRHRRTVVLRLEKEVRSSGRERNCFGSGLSKKRTVG